MPLPCYRSSLGGKSALAGCSTLSARCLPRGLRLQGQGTGVGLFHKLGICRSWVYSFFINTMAVDFEHAVSSGCSGIPPRDQSPLATPGRGGVSGYDTVDIMLSISSLPFPLGSPFVYRLRCTVSIATSGFCTRVSEQRVLHLRIFLVSHDSGGRIPSHKR